MTLTQGRYYKLNLVKPYTHKGPLFIYFSAVVKKSTLHLYGDFDIRGLFFDEVGMGTYLSLVDDNTDIFICSPITSTDPIQVDDKNAFALPKSIIDFNESEEWMLSHKFTFVVEGIERYLPSIGERTKFRDNVEQDIISVCSETDRLVGDLLVVNGTEVEFLKSKSAIKTAKDHQQKLLDKRRIRNETVANAQEEQYMSLLREQHKLNKMTTINNNKILELDEKTQKALAIQGTHVNLLSKMSVIKNGLKDVYDYLKTVAENLETEITPFNEIWENNLPNIPFIDPDINF